MTSGYLTVKSDEAFQRLASEEVLQLTQNSSGTQARNDELNIPRGRVSAHSREPEDDRILVAMGYGDLSKGLLICKRVADMAARAELAKLIRVRVTERSIDRVEERTGREFIQDIEVVREENTAETLYGVKIVERSVNRIEGTCSSKAIMPTELLAPAGMRDDKNEGTDLK